MLSSEEIRSITFERSMRGYRTEDVDAFLEKIAAGVDQLNAERDDLQKKLYILAQKVEEYRSEEETLKSALLNAQRLGENVIHEAKIKSDGMIREATGKAQRILEAADLREREEKDRLRALEAEVTAFKGSILALYQKHIEALSELDGTVEKVHISVFGEEPAPETEEQNAAADESAIESSETPQEMAVPDENEGQN
ncbi:MAG TPA: DivIVA domain-containing protein [Candidatus Pygmaiobacter gallistercoris]|nr:DivIVA domain-containing protein [Candidatus Pygmaiobacter gallistercoris]